MPFLTFSGLRGNPLFHFPKNFHVSEHFSHQCFTVKFHPKAQLTPQEPPSYGRHRLKHILKFFFGFSEQQKEALETQIHTYQSILEQIREFSGESDIDRLSAQFLKQEEENFALFNYVNELNNEVSLGETGSCWHDLNHKVNMGATVLKINH